MNIPTTQLVATHDHDSGLTLYNAAHGFNTDFWKGVVVDDVTGKVVARSFRPGPTVTTTDALDDLSYVPGAECTILRFYRHNGTPMISTHRNINIVGTRSRIGNGHFLFDIVRDAIAKWETKYEVYEDEDGSVGVAYTPTTWEDLCVDDWCNVFILLDISNQKTDLLDTDLHQLPLLYHSMSLSNSTVEMSAFSSPPTWKVSNTKVSDIVGGDDHGNCDEVTWFLPRLPVFGKKVADHMLKDGGTVIGFHSNTPDITTRYVSPAYSRKLELANESTNMVHRWHELMDEDHGKASEYLLHLPRSLSHIDEKYMMGIHNKYVEDFSKYLANIIVARYTGYDSPMPEILERKSKVIVDNQIKRLKGRYSRGARPPAKDKLVKLVEKSVREELSAHTYSFIHQLHSKMYRYNIEKALATRVK